MGSAWSWGTLLVARGEVGRETDHEVADARGIVFEVRKADVFTGRVCPVDREVAWSAYRYVRAGHPRPDGVTGECGPVFDAIAAVQSTDGKQALHQWVAVGECRQASLNPVELNHFLPVGDQPLGDRGLGELDRE